MTSRWFPASVLVGLLAGLAWAQEKARVVEEPRRSAPVTAALAAAKTDLLKAIAILETAVETTTDDRDALYLLGAMTIVRGETSDIAAERLAMFRKSTAAFARFRKAYGHPTPSENAFLNRGRIGEACVLASEGKVEEAIGVIQTLLASGFGDIGAFDDAPELEAVRKRPAFRTAIEWALRPRLLEEMARVKPFPFDFTLDDLDGKAVRLADLRGQVTIVDIWGTWCPPCRQEVPHLVELHGRYKDKGLAVIGINCEESGTPAEIKRKVEQFAGETGITYRCVLNDGKTEAKIPHFEGYPTTLFLDRSGTVRIVLVGYTPMAKLELIVTTLLDKAPKSDDRARGLK